MAAPPQRGRQLHSVTNPALVPRAQGRGAVFSFAALSAHQCSHSQCRSICPCRGMSLPIVCRNERREGKIAFCWMLKVLNTLRFRRDHVSKHPPRVPSVRKLWEWWSRKADCFLSGKRAILLLGERVVSPHSSYLFARSTASMQVAHFLLKHGELYKKSPTIARKWESLYFINRMKGRHLR